MNIQREFPLLEILRLRMYSLKNSESQCVDVYFFFASYFFYKPKVA